MLATLYVIAAEAPGRGGSPDEGWGVLTIVGVILVVALVIGLAVLLLMRRTRDTGDGRGRHRSGSVGRVP